MSILVATSPTTFRTSGDFVSADSIVRGFNHDYPNKELVFVSSVDDPISDYSGWIRYTYPYNKFRYQLYAFKYLNSLFESLDIKVFHYHLGSFNVINYLEKIKIPTVVTIHTPPDINVDLSYRYHEQWLRYVKDTNNIIVFPSEYAMKGFMAQLKLIDSLDNRLRVVYHGVLSDIDLTKYISNEKSLDYIAIGRLDPVKNFKLMSDILGNKLIIVGGLSPHSKEPLVNWVKYFINNGTKWLPPMNKYSLYKLISKAKYHISFSKVETFGFTLLDSASVGVPSIVFDSGGLGELSHMLDIPTIPKHVRKRNEISQYIERLSKHYDEINEMSSYDTRLCLSEKVNKLFNIDSEVSIYNSIYKELYEKI